MTESPNQTPDQSSDLPRDGGADALAAPLHGLRVLEFGEFIATPYAGKLLADLGAEVWKYEPAGGDVSRRYGPFPDGRQDPEASGLFSYLNTNKRSVSLDSLPGGLAAVVADFVRADVVLPDAAVLTRLGASVDELHERAPATTLIVLSAFGLSGPYMDVPATDLVCAAAGGISVSVGEPERRPLPLPQSQMEYQAGTCAAIAALMSVISRDVTRASGEVIEIATAEVMASLFSGYFVPRYIFGGGLVGQRCGRTGGGTPYPNTVFECADGLIRLDTPQVAQWIRLIELMGTPEWSRKPRYRARRDMQTNYKEECDALVAPWFQQYRKKELFDTFEERRLPYAPVLTGGDLLTEPQLQARHAIARIDLSGASRQVAVPAPPYLFACARPVLRPAPALGSSNGTAPPADREEPRGPAAAGGLPLAGIRVLDLGTAWAGGLAGRMLADFGADVIKVESWSHMDGSRKGRPILVDDTNGGDQGLWPDMQPGFHVHSRGKRSLAVNLKTERGRDLCLKLASQADLLLHNFPAGEMDRLGLRDAALLAANPRLVLAGQSIAGATGPRSSLIGYAGTVSALSGLASEVGYANEAPIAMFEGLYNDVVSALCTAFGALAGLAGARRTGRGVAVDISQWEAAMALAPEILLRETLDPGSGVLGGDYHPIYFPHGNFRAEGDDAWVAIAVRDAKEWTALCELVDELSWAEELADLDARRAEAARIVAVIDEWTARRPARESARLLWAAGIPAFPVFTIEDFFLHDLYHDRGVFTEVDHPLIGTEPMPGRPWRYLTSHLPPLSRAPLLGEHSHAIVTEVAGLSEDEYDELLRVGVIEVASQAETA